MDRMPTTPATTLGEAKQWLRGNLMEGAPCPCCTQFAKVYRRRIHTTMARALIQLYRHGARGEDFIHAPSLPGDTHEISQAVWWGLIEEERVRREDGGRAGWWTLTKRGVDFVQDRARVPEYALVYDGSPIRTEGDLIGIRDALGKRFRYDDLMQGA